MMDLFPPENPELKDADDAKSFRPTSEWDIVRGYLVQGLIVAVVVFLLSFLFTALPGRHGRVLSLTLGERLLLSLVVSALGVAKAVWQSEN